MLEFVVCKKFVRLTVCYWCVCVCWTQ